MVFIIINLEATSIVMGTPCDKKNKNKKKPWELHNQNCIMFTNFRCELTVEMLNPDDMTLPVIEDTFITVTEDEQV